MIVGGSGAHKKAGLGGKRTLNSHCLRYSVYPRFIRLNFLRREGGVWAIAKLLSVVGGKGRVARD